MLVSTLCKQTFYNKFITALPITRICLLLLGGHPSPFVALQILKLINVCSQFTSSFSRKFELVSGWSVLKNVMPSSWSSAVNEAAFDILLGRNAPWDKAPTPRDPTAVVCPHIIPTILAALRQGLSNAASRAHLSDEEVGE
jgi:hypothetical protein